MESLIDMDRALTVADMAYLLKLSQSYIRRELKAGTFMIPPLPDINRQARWWGPTVREWLEQRSYGVPAPPPAGVRTNDGNDQQAAGLGEVLHPNASDGDPRDDEREKI